MRRVRLVALLLAGLLLCSACPAACAEEAQRPVIKHYLVLGTDNYVESSAVYARSDVMILVSLDPAGNRLIFTSILRDSKVVTNNNGYENKINSIFRNSGYEGLKKVIKRHLDIDIEGSVIFDFDTIKQLIDAVGGVQLDLSLSECRAIQSILMQKGSDLPENAGLNQMTGRTALAYMRIRSVGNGDFSRTERQRTVLTEMMKKCRTLSLTDLLGLYNIVRSGISTDLGSIQMLQALQSAYPLMGAQVIGNYIPADGTFSYGTLRNSSVLDVNWKKNRQRLEALLYPPAPDAANPS